MITLKNLSKKYGTKQVLKDINFEFKKGNIYGIVGENGAGKTTLFNCISGIEKFDGTIITKTNNFKDKLGYLMTELFFFDKITGKEYLQLLTYARGIKINDFNTKNIFDLPLNEYISTYSTGMKKKIALTGVLLQENDVFILDEPFNGVDIQSNIIITEIIQRLKQAEKTVLISSHIFTTLSNICDEILVLKDTKVTQIVTKNDFEKLETEMKKFSIGNKLDKFKF